MANTLKFKSAKELRDKLEGFNSWLVDKGYQYRTLERLCEYLDCSRQTLLNYVNGIEQGIESGEIDKIGLEILRAKRQLLADTVDRLFDRNMSRGAEFLLKNNHGYSDRQDLNIGGDGVKVTLGPDVAGLAK